MKAYRTFLIGLLVAGIAIPHAALAQAPAPPSYLQILKLYEHGRIDEALAALAMIADSKVQSGQKLIFKTLEQTIPGEAPAAAGLLRVGALIHAAEAFRLAHHDPGGAVRHLNVARAYVAKVQPRGREPSFVRDWWLMVISVFQGHFDLVMANELGRQARDSVGESPELLLAIGVTQEMAWTKTHDDDGEFSLKGDVEDAESAYRKALTLQPDLVEARLRLGRILTLRGRIDDALETLGPIDAAADPASRYLGRLFEGEALERAGRAAEAEQRYLAAFAALPEAQSARLALAHLRHAHGARTEAANEVRGIALNQRVGETVDPWYWYLRGLYCRADGYMRSLQAQVQP
jgi:tetratricopeptide (TPR) repeat protein